MDNEIIFIRNDRDGQRLIVGDTVVAVEGDPLRDRNLARIHGDTWTAAALFDGQNALRERVNTAIEENIEERIEDAVAEALADVD